MIETIIGNLNISRIMMIIKKRIFFIIIFAALGGMVAGYYSMNTSTEVYSAKVSMYIYSDPDYLYDSTVNVTYSETRSASGLVPSYMLILTSDTVLQKVIDELGLMYTTENMQGMISSTAIKDTAVFNFYVFSQDPYEAMAIANAIADIAPGEIARVIKSGGVEVIDYAKLSDEPYSQTDIIKVTVMGIVGAGGVAFVMFLFFGLADGTIRKRDELNDVFNIPILGDIPHITKLSRKIEAKKILDYDSPFALKESYNMVRSNIMFTGKGEKCPVFVVSSADKSDGKTMNCINIAISFAFMGKKTLLIDGDLRNPTVNRVFDIESDTLGLSELLAGLVEEGNIISTETENLSLLCSGSIPPNPSDLLSSQNFQVQLENLKNDYDYIFIDTPPIGLVHDAVSLAEIVTGYILVVKSNISKIDHQKRIVSQLEYVDGQISGFLYNGINPKSVEYKHGYYTNAYDPNSKKGKKNKKSSKKKS